jgi:hypothetical protein
MVDVAKVVKDAKRQEETERFPPVSTGCCGCEPYNSGTISSATMLMILMSGFTAGPAVSL